MNIEQEYQKSDMFISKKLALIKINNKFESHNTVFLEWLTSNSIFRLDANLPNTRKTLVLKSNEGIDVSNFIDLSKLTTCPSNKLYFITSMFRIAQTRPAYNSYTEHLNNVNILYTGSANLNPSVKYEDALFHNNCEKIFDKTYCYSTYLKFKKLHDIIDENIYTKINWATMLTSSIQTIHGNIFQSINYSEL